MIKKLFMLGTLLLVSSSMVSANTETICTMEYAPVCGSDGKTYGNACMAKGAGITSTTPGECANPTKACIKAGEMTNGAVAPEYQTSCCMGLESIDPYDQNESEAIPTGGGMYCYDPAAGKPYCKDGECTFPTSIAKPRADTVLPSATQDKISAVLDKIFASFMTNGTLNDKGKTLATRLVAKLDSMMVAHIKMLEISRFTEAGYKTQLEKGALLDLIKTLLNKKMSPTATGKIDPKTCKTYFDGCNTCMISDEGMSACTKKYCETPTQPYCMETR